MYSEISFLHLITEIQSLTARAFAPKLSFRRLPRPFAKPQNSVIEGGFPHSEIRGSKLLRSSPRLSQRSTSFIASQRQGIHRMPLSHLIALIINAHPTRQQAGRSFLRTVRPVGH